MIITLSIPTNPVKIIFVVVAHLTSSFVVTPDTKASTYALLVASLFCAGLGIPVTVPPEREIDPFPISTLPLICKVLVGLVVPIPTLTVLSPKIIELLRTDLELAPIVVALSIPGELPTPDL